MKLYVDIDGTVKLEISREEVRSTGLSGTLNKWVDAKVDDAVATTSEQKAFEYMQALGELADQPITDLVFPSKVIEFTEPDYEDENPFPEQGECGQWTCTVCGSPNTVSVDDGCTNCDH